MVAVLPAFRKTTMLRAARSALSVKLSLLLGSWLAPRPFIMVWESTHRCNSRCVYCGLRSLRENSEPALSTAEIKRVIDEASDLGLFCLVISGGEPLLRKDLSEVVAHARARGLFVSLTTNGILASGGNLGLLSACRHVTVSLDGIDPADYARRRGVDRFDEVVGNILRIRESCPHTALHVQAVLDETNWRDAPAMSRFFFDRGIDTVFQLVYGRRFEIDGKEWGRIVDRLRFRSPALKIALKRFLGLLPAISSGRLRGPCLALTSNFALSPSGKLIACNYRREPLADLRRETLASAWGRLEARRRRLASPDRGCMCGNSCFIIPSLILS
jgi:MoaA/NifB/PqqE/SkfB family radical SAM enzyme